MKSTPVKSTKQTPVAPKARVLTEAQYATMNRVQTVIGYVIIGLSIVGAVALNIMGQLPIPVTVGLILLAVFRLFALKRELRQCAAEQA